MTHTFKRLCLVLGFASLAFSNVALADFSLTGELNAVDPRGKSIKKDMPMAFTQVGDDFKFKIGKFEYKVPSRPEKYSIALVLQDNNFVWVQEFNKRPIKSFEWKLGEHNIRLYKEVLKKPVKGDYILAIDDKDYFFKNKLAQITFIYNEEGIEAIEVDGMVASIGLNRAKDECASQENKDKSAEEGSEEASAEDKKECEPPKG
ncbi:hypothetical protein J1N51_02625 [Psychrosphaera ytuae]|uniref:Uncharacterized protein n=1 Tax=Psychrosphaera ytuae TaxID=2820710 RepID=A0A975DC56_9GAMM|nr:hypothetical protein [Psychrosphaera ytuae]QTH64401.1 hypothetical protein J1N51_02625 [Psychrosphaera ytuae]